MSNQKKPKLRLFLFFVLFHDHYLSRSVHFDLSISSIESFIRFYFDVEDITKVLPQKPVSILYIGLCCTWTFLHHSGLLELHLDLYGQHEQVLFLEVPRQQEWYLDVAIQRHVLHMDVSSHGCIFTTGA